MVDRVGHRWSNPGKAEFADALGLEWRNGRVHLIDEKDFQMRDVSVDRYFVAGEVVVDEEAEFFVDRHRLHQSGTDAHCHAAYDLAARQLGIEDASRRADGQHPPNTDFARVSVDSHLRKMRAEGL